MMSRPALITVAVNRREAALETLVEPPQSSLSGVARVLAPMVGVSGGAGVSVSAVA